MPALDQPDDPNDLWRALGDDVSAARPLMQGDVITLSTGPVCIVAHPCSMRKGADLHQNQTVASIENKAVKKWNGSLDWMPLSGIEIPGIDDPAANLRVLQAEPTHYLKEGRRAGTMSDYGIHLLQQRLACHLTRVVIDLAELDEHSAPVLAEIELIEEWVEEFGASGETELQELLEADDRKLRGWLQETRTRPQAIRAVRKALIEKNAHR